MFIPTANTRIIPARLHYQIRSTTCFWKQDTDRLYTGYCNIPRVMCFDYRTGHEGYQPITTSSRHSSHLNTNMFLMN